jgi:hypothetical protein
MLPAETSTVVPAPRFPWRQPTILVLFLVCIGVAASSLTYYSWHLFTEKHRPLVRGIDNNYYFFWLPSVLIDHDLDFTNQLNGSPTLPEEDLRSELAEPLTRTGLRYNKFPIGWALASAPWFEAAHLLSVACGWPTTGWEPPYQIAIWLGQLSYAWLGLWFAWRVLAHFFPPNQAAWALSLGWLSSPLVYYQTAGLSMTHSLLFSLVALAVWLGIKIQSDARLRWFALLGAASGLLLVTRYTAVVYLVIPATAVLSTMRQAKKCESAVRLLTAAAASLPPILLQMASWKIIYGSWFVYSYGGEHFQFGNPHLIDVLFSPFHGFIYWHPLMGLGIAGLLIWSLRDARGRAWACAFGITYFLNASWWCWWFGGSFGNRAFEGCIFLAMAGLAWFFAQGAPWLRRATLALSTAAAVWNILLFALFLAKRIPSGAPCTWLEMWKAAWGMS